MSSKEIVKKMHDAVAENHQKRLEDERKAGVKSCFRCGEEKLLDQFYKEKRYNSYNAYCIPCRNLQTAASEHGLSIEDYAKRRLQSCEICGVYKEPGGRGGGMHIDHDHTTNLLRGTLCDRCNRGIGMFDDDPEKLSATVTYILKWRKEHENIKKEEV